MSGWGVPKDLTNAPAFYQKACAGGPAQGCEDATRLKEQ
jgi:hypothetical protein